jgi:hypothetical protein
MGCREQAAHTQSNVGLEQTGALTIPPQAVYPQHILQSILDCTFPAELYSHACCHLQLCQSCRGDGIFLVLAELPALQHLRVNTCVSSQPSLLADISRLTGLTALEVEDKGLVGTGALPACLS